MRISKTIVETLFLFAVLLVSCSEAVGIEKIQARKVNSTNTHPGEMLPTDDYSVCAADIIQVANCGLGNFMQCSVGNVAIFQQSWNINEMTITGGLRTASTYLKCEWIGAIDDGYCESKPVDTTVNFCYSVDADQYVSVSRTPSPTPSSSRTPSSTPSSSRTPSQTPSSSRTPSQTPSSSRTPSQTPANSLTASVSATRTSSPSRSPSFGSSLSRTRSNSGTRMATVSRMASSTRAASMSVSSDPFLACHSLVTPGYDRLVVKIADVPDISVGLGGFWQINLGEYFCDPEDGPIHYTVEGNLPAGLIQEGEYLKGTAQAAGTFHITVYAWDGNVDNGPSPGTTFWVNVSY